MPAIRTMSAPVTNNDPNDETATLRGGAGPNDPTRDGTIRIADIDSQPLPELMTELISDEQPRNALFKQVGIKPREESR